MNIIRTDRVKKYLPQMILWLSLLGLYGYTLAPGLTWANGGSDGGDLITAAATGGIPHPTGYPLYLLLARLFQYLPVGTLAFRTNLMSAVFTSLAALLIFEIVTRSVSHRLGQPWLVGMVAAYAFGLAPLIWSQAVITEVYALQSFLIVLIIYLYTMPASVFSYSIQKMATIRGLSLGLAVSNHVTALLIVPMALALGSVSSTTDDSHQRKLEPGSLGRQCLGLVIGLSPYLILPLRALTHPAVNWGNPVTLQNFWWLVSGQLYQSYYFQSSFAAFWGHLQAAVALFFEQFGFMGAVLGVLGLVLFVSKSRLYALTLWIAILHAVFACYYGTQDSYLYLIPAFACFAIWMGLGAAGLIHRLAEHAFVRGALFLALTISYLILRSLTVIPELDASDDLRAESFGREVLNAVPQNAILFAKGDQAIFTLWYFDFALRERPDLSIVAVDLLHFDWYQENIRSIYPSLIVPGPFPWPQTIAQANPLRAACYVQYTSHAEIDCSKPLTAP